MGLGILAVGLEIRRYRIYFSVQGIDLPAVLLYLLVKDVNLTAVLFYLLVESVDLPAVLVNFRLFSSNFWCKASILTLLISIFSFN